MFNPGGFLPTITLPFGLVIPTYFLISSASFIICLFWLAKRTERRGLSRNHGLDIALVLMLTGFIGSRLFHVFFEEPEYYFENPLRIFEVWQGGFVWYGGALVGGGAALAFAKWKKLPLATWLDVFAPLCALGYALGRVACLMTGCCYGSVITFASGFQMRHPTQGYAILWESGSLILLLTLERKVHKPRSPHWLKRPGQIFFVWLILHSLGRLMMESFRADPRGFSPLGLSPAIWISGLILLGSLTQVYSSIYKGSVKKWLKR